MATYIPLYVGKGNQQHSQEILSKRTKKREMEAFREVWEGKKKEKKEKGIPALMSRVQG